MLREKQLSQQMASHGITNMTKEPKLDAQCVAVQHGLMNYIAKMQWEPSGKCAARFFSVRRVASL